MDVGELFDDEVGAVLVVEVGDFEIGDGVGAAGPGKVGEVCAVMDAVVIERDEVLAFDGVPEAHFVGDAVLEPGEDAGSIHAFGGGGESKEDGGLEGGDEVTVAGGRDVMRLIEDGVMPEVGADGSEEVAGVEALDGCE